MLLTLVSLPLVGAGLITLGCKRPVEVYSVGLFTTILTFIQSLIIYSGFNFNTSQYQFVILSLGIDGISLLLVMLTTFLTCIILLSSWKSIKIQTKWMVVLLLLIEALTLCVFLAMDLLLFYISFESVLIPLFLMIGIYGGRQRKIQAAYSLFIYTIAGSLVLFLGIIYIYFEYGTTNYLALTQSPMNVNVQYFLWLAFFMSFAVKVPMYPFTIWLPEAHVEAPTAGSVLLAGIILKLGTYGFIRFSLGILPDASLYFRPFIFTVALIGIIYSSIACLAQLDIKKVIAYSSIGHMNTSILGIFSNNVPGLTGSVYFMISHGLVSSALFLLIGVLYDRYHTRTILYYRGLTMVMPLFSVLFFVFTLANIAFPGTSSFIAEFLTFLGSFTANPVLSLLATTSIILAPLYSLWFFHQMAFGSFSKFLPRAFTDISLKEFNLILPLLAFTIILGLKPNLLIDPLIFSINIY